MISAGKSTLINALLEDEVSKVALEQPTAGVNFFYIARDNGGFTNAVCEEISKDNRKLRSSDVVKEKTFDIRINHRIVHRMPKDTQLVLVDIPGINETKSRKKYKDYVESNWKDFDCVVVVIDVTQFVPTELLKFVEQNNRTLKNVPVIVVANKIDDPYEYDAKEVAEAIYSKTTEIFGNAKRVRMPSDRDHTKGQDKPSKWRTEFVALSAKNAFTYRTAKAVCNDGRVSDEKYTDLVNKIGYDEYGLKWFEMKTNADKISAVSRIFRDESGLKKRMELTNFDNFCRTFMQFLNKSTQDIAFEKEVGDIRFESLGEEEISEWISTWVDRLHSIGRLKDTIVLRKKFWEFFTKCEDESFEKHLERHVDPTAIGRPFVQLENYHKLLSECWTSEFKGESVRVVDAMKGLLRRQLNFVLKKLEAWSFESYCENTGGEKTTISDDSLWDCGRCNKKYCGRPGRDHRFDHLAYSTCGGKFCFGWKEGWITPKATKWSNLSPNDWILILESFSLVWNSSHFVEDFGRYKLKFEAALTHLRYAVATFYGMNFDIGTASNTSDCLCLYAYKDQIKQNTASFASALNNPDSLVDPSHWGFLAWKYINFRAVKKRKASIEFDESRLLK